MEPKPLRRQEGVRETHLLGTSRAPFRSGTVEMGPRASTDRAGAGPARGRVAGPRRQVTRSSARAAAARPRVERFRPRVGAIRGRSRAGAEQKPAASGRAATNRPENAAVRGRCAAAREEIPVTHRRAATVRGHGTLSARKPPRCRRVVVQASGVNPASSPIHGALRRARRSHRRAFGAALRPERRALE
jgi:hypothetical protein